MASRWAPVPPRWHRSSTAGRDRIAPHNVRIRWSAPAASDQVTFLNLSPGHYRFVVRPVNLLGQVSAASATVEITIKPAFWQTLWFYLALLLVISFTVFFAVRKRIATIQRESGLKNRIAETEMMALRAQMNPHFIFNCMNIIDGLIAGNRKEEAQDFLQKFSRLIRLVLENSQHQLVSLTQEVEMLKLYAELETIRYTNFFTYTFDVDQALIDGNYKIPPLLLQPFVENAIVHGLRHKEKSGGLLTVSIRLQKSHILIRIEDNGIGRAKSLELNRENATVHNPTGLRLTHKRIDLLNQMNAGNVSIDIENLSFEEETGTRVIIKLPLLFRPAGDA